MITAWDPKPGVSISTLAYEYSPGFNVKEHAHGSDQLIYATAGLMEVSAGQTSWLVPPQFAVWIPARTLHRIRMPRAVSMRTLYLRPAPRPRLAGPCRALQVTPLLREMILEAVRIGSLRSSNRLEAALRDLILAQLHRATPIPTFVTMPADSRALAVAQAWLANPSDTAPLSELCENAGASVRTIERTFPRDTGMSFETWRRQARVVKAVELLVSGSSVKEAAFAVGYQQASAFVEMFRKTLGAAPKAWLSALQGVDAPTRAIEVRQIG